MHKQNEGIIVKVAAYTLEGIAEEDSIISVWKTFDRSPEAY